MTIANHGSGNTAADDVGGTSYPCVKLAYGGYGSATLVSPANPLPVSLVGGGGSSGGLTDTELRAAPVPVSGTFYPVTQPVSGTVSVSGSVAVTGSFYQATQPVSGTFWQATQPVSIAATVAVSAAALPLPSGAATETTLAALNTKTPTLGQAAMAASSPVVIASNQSAVPVSGTVTANAGTGTFAVSGPITDAQLRASAISVTFTNASLAVTGPLTDAQLRASAVPVSGPMTDAQMRASAVPVSIAATLNVSVQNASLAVTAPALTKGTQGANGFTVQNLKDAGRTQFSAATVIGGVTCVTTEAMLSMVPVRAGAAAAAGTSIQATSGKTLRFTAIIFSHRSTSAAVLSGRCALRMNPNGAAVASSPIIAIAATTQQAAALAEAGDTCVVPLPDGIEISGTQQIGLSQVCSAITGVVYATLIGFEY